jgi:predicted metalloprotease with PDZ domain
LEYRESAAHLSWIDGDRGILVLDDILPQAGLKTARVKLDLPAGWKVFTTEQPIAANEYNIDDMEKAVFVIGRGWREKDIMSGKSRLRLLVAGDWLFSDDEAVAQAAEVFEHYQRLFRSAPEQPFQIAVTRFPVRVPIGNWEAGSRGSTITMVSSDMAFKSQSLQRLHEQLRHEIFHLWVPHGLALDGNYDWFYEGFALYESLKLGVSVNRIRFEDMLETLSRAYAADSRVPDGVFGKRQSLIAASEGRWSGSNTTVYARGMLVAFLCDLAALDASKGKRTISDDLRNVYERHRAPGPTHDANAAVLAVLRKHPELVPVIDSYVTGDQKINWGPYLQLAGLEAVPAGNSPNLRVAAKLTGRQKQLLNKLGYNNWRKMASNNR